MAWDGWGGRVMGGDGSKQEAPPVTLFVNRKAAARQDRRRALADRSSRRARQVKADKQRKLDRVKAGKGLDKPKTSWW
jgi:hypothetical protein